MGNQLQIRIEHLDQEAIVYLEGKIDEDANLAELKNLEVKKITFNFEGVTLLNSCGIREWINLLNSISPDITIVYTRCPKIIIEQINGVHGFVRDGASIDSFYAPYYCNKCNEEKNILILPKEVVGDIAPKIKCEKCGEELEFDAIEVQYFNFLK